MADKAFNNISSVAHVRSIVPRQWPSSPPRGDDAYQCAAGCHTIPKIESELGKQFCEMGRKMLQEGLMRSAEYGIKPNKNRPSAEDCQTFLKFSDVCQKAGVTCWLSLETPMACGFGACFSCVVKVRTSNEEWDFRRTCVEGPVFRADELVL